MIVLFSLFGIFILGLNLLRNVRCGKYINIVNIVSIIAILDLYLPAIIGALSGEYFTLPYIAPLNDSEVLTTVIVADFAYGLMLFAYSFYKPKSRKYQKFGNTIVYIKRVKFIFLVSVFIYVLNLFFEFKSFGGWTEFYTFKLTRAYAVTAEPQGVLARMVAILSETTFIIMLMMFSIMLTYKDKIPKKEFIKFLVLIICICIFSLSRGTIIGVFISIIATYEYNANLFIGGLSRDFKNKVKKFVIIGACAFLLFGGLRNALQNTFFQEENTSISENIMKAANNTLGNSLIALTRTIRYVDSGKPLFEGQSYLEMSLSLIPRTILPNKPQLYGVQTLSMANGSPESTMDAITIPGEILMNFGYIGLILMIFWGMIFKFFDSFRYKARMKYFLSAAVFTLSTTCCWMSFTGFFAQTKYLIIYYVVLSLVVKYRKQI